MSEQAGPNPFPDSDPRNEAIREVFAETAILLTHSDEARRALAKERVYARMFPATPKSSEGELLDAAEELVASLSLNDEDGLTEFAEPMVKMRAAIARAKAGKARS